MRISLHAISCRLTRCNIPFWDIPSSDASLVAIMPKPAPAKSLFSPEYDAFLVSLRKARTAAGLTQTEAAKRLKRPQSFVSKCESGERRVDVVELLLFCRAYGADASRFVKSLSSAI
jgi:hypothetical protein